MSTVGGFGNNQSNSIWFKYKATHEVEGQKKPLGKLCRWNKDKEKDEEYSWVAGELVSVSYRLNEGKPDKGVDPFNEMILTLRGVDGAGEVWSYKIPLRASGIAAFGVARRLHNFEAGDIVHVGAGVIDDQPQLWIHEVMDDDSRQKVEPVNAGLEFRPYEGLSGARLAAAKNENAAMREEWVEKTVKGLSFYEDGNGASSQRYVSAQNAPVQPAPGATPDDYDPFADE